MTRPTFLSLFAGVGGFDLGLEAAGWRCVGQVEIDPQARAVLRHRWPHVPKMEDVRHVGAAQFVRGSIDLICGGFPCQDLSVAGRRRGLAGERSGLFYEFMRIVDELAPRWVLLENVPGLLSSNGGRDMGAVLGTLGELGYGYAYRVLDLQHWGVPQRRRRVFIVACAGGVCPPEVLFEPESVFGNPAPRGEAGEGATGGFEEGAGSACDGEFNPARGGVIGSLSTGAAHQNRAPLVVRGVAPSLFGSGAGAARVASCATEAEFIMLTPAGEAYHLDRDKNASRGIAGTLQSHGTGGCEEIVLPAGAVAFAENQRGELRTSDTHPQLTTGGGKPGQGFPAVLAPQGAAIAFHPTQDPISSPQARASLGATTLGMGVLHGAPTLQAEGSTREVLRGVRGALGEEAFRVWCAGVHALLSQAEVLRPDVHGAGTYGEDEDERSVVDDGPLPCSENLPARTVREVRSGAGGGASPERGLAGQSAREPGAALSELPHQGASVEDVLAARLHGSAQGPRVLREALSTLEEVGRSARVQAQRGHAVAIPRRLTPRETERLQGWPDEHTRWGVTEEGKRVEMADGPRYRMAGNGVGAPVAEWIGRRLLRAHVHQDVNRSRKNGVITGLEGQGAGHGGGYGGSREHTVAHENPVSDTIRPHGSTRGGTVGHAINVHQDVNHTGGG